MAEQKESNTGEECKLSQESCEDPQNATGSVINVINNSDNNNDKDKVIKDVGKENGIPLSQKRKIVHRANVCEKSNEVTEKRLKIDKNPESLEQHAKRVVTKPPLPPKDQKPVTTQKRTATMPRSKKAQPEATLVQKLVNSSDQLRLEISELKAALASEKMAVRELRAQSDAENRKAKIEMKKKQNAQLESSKKAANKRKTGCDELVINDSIPNTVDVTKLNQEICLLKDANRVLEEKIQISSQAERRKVADIRELKDSYEQRLTQISKSAKIEMHRLLEEIKAKEKTIEQLKKDNATNRITHRKDGKTAQNVQNMRKEKEIERSNCSTNNKINNTSTCGDKLVSMPHEIHERIPEAHTDLQFYGAKDNSGSDNDSALSSAPQSLSPQPGTFHHSTDVWQTFVKESHKELENLQKDYESLQEENQFLSCELSQAKDQIVELEKVLLATHDTNVEMHNRIGFLEQKSETLSKESHELREQNELLEFRIIELEESHDKWSLRSNATPDTRDMWTDTDQESDFVLMLSDRSDSGITSPYSHRQTDISSPCELLSMEHIQYDDIRRRIEAMSKKSCYEEDDKLCLHQVLTLLNNLDAIPQDQDMVGSEFSINPTMNLQKDAINFCQTPVQSRIPLGSNSKSPERIVATVQPYSSDKQFSRVSIQESPKKCQNSLSSSLQESGVFEVDTLELCTQATQTEEGSNFSEAKQTTGDLCAEIQKLNKFRKKIEECVTKSSGPIVNLLTPNSSDQRRLEYYKERLELLENKVLVYESSGDLQVRRLAERLQREIQLEAWVKQLTERVDKLAEENLRLEEEKCEFEEAENDTRLRLQRLEVDLEMLRQQNCELEMSRENARAHASCLQETINKAQERIFALEEQRQDLKHKMEMLKMFMPTILMFNAWKMQEANRPIIDVPQPENDYGQCPCSDMQSISHIDQGRLQELMFREKELTQNIAELNRAYNETLESADNLWAQMEKEFKDRLAEAEDEKMLLKRKLEKFEDRLRHSSQSANERITQLEESELALKHRVCKLNRELKDQMANYSNLAEEFNALQDECLNLKKYIEGPAADASEKEKRKIKDLEEELSLRAKIHEELEEVTGNQMTLLKNQLAKVNKDLVNITVSNGELKEEVATLEKRLRELLEAHEKDTEAIQKLTSELESKEDELRALTGKRDLGKNLLDELKEDCSNYDPAFLDAAAATLTAALSSMEDCGTCQGANMELRDVAIDIKNLADLLLLKQGREPKQPHFV